MARIVCHHAGVLLIWLFACNDRLVDSSTSTLSTSDVTQVRITAVTGALRVIGKSVDTVQVTARLRTSLDTEAEIDLSDTDDTGFFADDVDQFAIDNGTVDTFTEAGDARVSAVLSDDVLSDYWYDVKVVMPLGLPVVVTGVSREVRVVGTAGAAITDDGGTIVVRNIDGDVAVTDEGGSINIVNVTGDVYVVDGDGSVVIKHVTGSATVEDGAGQVITNDVDGAVNVTSESGRVLDK